MKHLALALILVLITSTAMGQRRPVRQGAKLVASDGAILNDFGSSVAVSGDTVVIGANQENGSPGAAYVFVTPAGGWSGTLTEVAKLTASDAALQANFGYAVSISGDTIVVGAPWANSGGKAYVFVKPSGGWSGHLTENAKLVASQGQLSASSQFGASVAIDTDTVVVAGPWVGSQAEGASYVFVKPSTGWNGTLTENAKLTASNPSPGDTMGYSFDGHGVAILGDTIICGTYHLTGVEVPGRAFVFVKPIGGWNGDLTQTAELNASDGLAWENFGLSVSLSARTVVIGEAGAMVGSNTRQGAAYVFAKPAGGWSGTMTETAKLTASDGQMYDNFGWSVEITSVGINKEEIFIGAPDAKVGSNTYQGVVYKYLSTAGKWKTTSRYDGKIVAWDGMPNDLFGWSVAAATKALLSGARLNPNKGPGAAYVFTGK